MKIPKISFIVPVYRSANFLGQCVDSLLKQNMSGIEIILVDDGSPDCCPQLCDDYEKLDKRIRVIHKKNGGVSDARNWGLKAATGEWISFVDSDDWISEDFCKVVQPLLTENINIILLGWQDVCRGKAMPKARETHQIKELNSREILSLHYNLLNKYERTEFFDKNLYVTTVWGKLYRRLFLYNEGILFDTCCKVGEDTYFNSLCFNKTKLFIWVDMILYNYRRDTNELTRGYNKDLPLSYKYTLDEIKDVYLRYHLFEKIKKQYLQFKISCLMFCVLNCFCHKDNENTYRRKRKDFLEYRNSGNFKDIDKADLKTFPWAKKVMCYLIKKRLFLFLYVIIRLYNLF